MHKLLQIYLIKRVKKFGVVHGPRGVGGQDFFFPGLNGKKKNRCDAWTVQCGSVFPWIKRVKNRYDMYHAMWVVGICPD